MSSTAIDVSLLGECWVLDEKQIRHQLASFWAERPAFFIFLRHFACIACRAHAVQMWGRRNELESRMGEIIFIGNGSPAYIEIFRESLDLKGARIFTDPSLLAFRMAGFQRGFLTTFGPKAIVNAVKLHKEGHRQHVPSRSAGDTWQLGGSLVIDTQGVVKHHYISEALGDFAPEHDLAADSD